MSPEISIIMPCFNGSRWISAAIESVLQQTFRDFEFIIINDGSTDNSADLIDTARSKDPRIRSIHLKKNAGIVNALNFGLDHALGRLIARMDADDICMPNRLAIQMAFLEAKRLDFCGSWFREFGQGPARTVRWPHSEPALRAAMLFQNTICHPTLMARRELFRRFRYREEYRLVEDYDLFGRAMAEFRIGNVPQSLLKYRRHSQQTTQAKRETMEVVSKKIRIEILRAQGIELNDSEQQAHHQIRSGYSILKIEDLEAVQQWLLKLLETTHDSEAKAIIASQWIRACVRAAPLGEKMWKAFVKSPLRSACEQRLVPAIDLRILATIQLDYRSPSFALLRRLGLSA